LADQPLTALVDARRPVALAEARREFHDRFHWVVMCDDVSYQQRGGKELAVEFAEHAVDESHATVRERPGRFKRCAVGPIAATGDRRRPARVDPECAARGAADQRGEQRWAVEAGETQPVNAPIG
jgi:hypothetical protein